MPRSLTSQLYRAARLSATTRAVASGNPRRITRGVATSSYARESGRLARVVWRETVERLIGQTYRPRILDWVSVYGAKWETVAIELTSVAGSDDWRRVRHYDIFEGTAEIQQLVISRAISGLQIQ
jgi:alkylation response protein AidB-like acyl-CoA dehydrogenase